MRRWLRVLGAIRSAADLMLALRILAFAACIPLLSRLGPARLGAALKSRETRPLRPARVHALLRLVDPVIAAGAPLVRPGCLTRGVTYYYFLTRAGLDVRLCFGIGIMDGQDAGHCWLEYEGQPFLEKRDPRLSFTEVYAIAGVGPAGAVS